MSRSLFYSPTFLLQIWGRSELVSILENHLRKRLLRRMRNTQRNILHSHPPRNLPRLAMQLHRRPPAALPHNFHIHPTHPAAPSRPQRLHRRFLRRKSSRKTLILILELLAILPLRRRIQPPQNRFPMPLDRRLYAPHLCDIDSQPNDQANSCSAGTLAGGFTIQRQNCCLTMRDRSNNRFFLLRSAAILNPLQLRLY